jgi:S1-C subfamily serine protease
MNKIRVFHAVEASKKGYVTRSHGFDVTKKLSPTVAFAVLDFIQPLAGPFILIFDFKSPKIRRFAPRQVVPAMVELAPKQTNEKYLLVENTSFDAASKDVRIRKYERVKHYDPSDTSSDSKGSDKMSNDDLKITSTIFTEELNTTLRDIGFIDTNKHIFTNANNTLYLDATIRKVVINNFSRRAMFASLNTPPNALVSVQLEVEWKVLDYYKQPVFTTTTKNTSDKFMVINGIQGSAGDREGVKEDQLGLSVALKKAIANNFELSLAGIRADLSKKGMLTIGAKGADTANMIALARPVPPGETARLNEMLKSSVSIKVDDGHGSGIIISEDGYIVTNYHVVAGSKNIEVIFNDDTKATGKVIRHSTLADLALVKVEKNGLKALPLSDTKDPEIGVDVWAIGTPRSLELGQTLSKGIVSSVRKANDLAYIQTDVTISPGNSGGALINRKGEINGIITSKLMGFGTEGVGFALQAYLVLEQLRLQYK